MYFSELETEAFKQQAKAKQPIGAAQQVPQAA
jgi:hypothetical protein